MVHATAALTNSVLQLWARLRRRGVLYGVWLVVWATAAGLGDSAAMAAPPVEEFQVKAAFVCKFAQYVEWPPQVFAVADSPLVIGFVGPDALADALVRSAAETLVQGRPVVVKRVSPGEALGGVHVLYVASRGTPGNDILAEAKGRPLLTVTEEDPWSASQSMINFVIADAKVRFDVALPVAEASNLRISARLLTVARRVVGAKQ